MSNEQNKEPKNNEIIRALVNEAIERLQSGAAADALELLEELKKRIAAGLVLLLLTLAACDVNPSVVVEVPTPSGDIVQVVAPPVEQIVGATTETEVVEAPALTVFKNWGALDSEMSIDFTNAGHRITDCDARHAPNCELKVDASRQSWFAWNRYDAGQYGVSGRENMWCVGKITFAGTESEGTVTISDTSRGWSIDPDADLHSTYCSDHDGTYAYRVTEAGLEFDGRVYAEVQ